MRSIFKLVELVKLARIFKRNRKKIEIKVLAFQGYYLVMRFYQNLRIQVIKNRVKAILEVINQIAIDETVINGE